MRGNIARFVVDTHCHITTLYQPATEAGWEMVEREEWNGLSEELAPFDNCSLDHVRHGPVRRRHGRSASEHLRER